MRSENACRGGSEEHGNATSGSRPKKEFLKSVATIGPVSLVAKHIIPGVKAKQRAVPLMCCAFWHRLTRPVGEGAPKNSLQVCQLASRQHQDKCGEECLAAAC